MSDQTLKNLKELKKLYTSNQEVLQRRVDERQISIQEYIEREQIQRKHFVDACAILILLDDSI